MMAVQEAKKLGRNDPCFCGSGKKYKKCCEGKPATMGVIDLQTRLEAALELYEKGEYLQTEQMLMSVLQENPFQTEALFLLGRVGHAMGQLDAAIMLYKRSIASDPTRSNYNLPSFYYRLGLSLYENGDYQEALDIAKEGLEINDKNPKLYQVLGLAYSALSQNDLSYQAYLKVREVDPDYLPDDIEHHINALEGKTTEKAPDNYVKGLFDGYADKFEGHLIHGLGYKTPTCIADALLKVSPQVVDQQNVILDLGCGTGLMGACLQEKSIPISEMMGVDLSPNMLEEAEKKEIYTSLHESELVSFMEEVDQTFDIILSADVFVYIGDLEPIFKLWSGSLNADGTILFSVEKFEGDEEPYTLRGSGRYAHSAGYIEGLAKTYGFEVSHREEQVIRTEKRKDIEGYIYVLRLIN